VKTTIHANELLRINLAKTALSGQINPSWNLCWNSCARRVHWSFAAPLLSNYFYRKGKTLFISWAS